MITNLVIIVLTLTLLMRVSVCTQPDKRHSHSIPKKIWIYKQPQTTLFEELNLLNTIHLASIENYSIHQVDHQTYSQHLSPNRLQQIQLANQSMISHFKTKNILNQNSAQSVISSNIQRLIIYALLAEHGGVYIDQTVTLVEPLNAFFDFTISKNQLVNGGHRIYQNAINYCLGFYNESFSSFAQNLNHLKSTDPQPYFWQFKPHLTLYPNLEDYFIACTNGNSFIQNLFQTYTQILTKAKNWQYLSQFNSKEELIGMTNPHLIFDHGHLIASHWVLQKSQSALNPFSPNSLAINILGFIAINSRLGPTKIKTQFSLDDYKIYQYLSKLTLPEIQLAIGRLHSVFKFNPGVQRIIQKKLMSFENPTQFWVRNSFAHVFWIKHIQQYKDQQKFSKLWRIVSTFSIAQNSFNNQEAINDPTQIKPSQYKKIVFDDKKPKWQSLEKNIWIIWDNGVEGKSNLIVELCYENLKRSALKSGFKFHAVSRNTVHDYLSRQMIQKIDRAVKNASFDLSRQAVSDLWRMALVYEHGGVYFDASTFSTDESFEWIVRIPQIQQNLVWNRYGEQPQVFMLWNTFYGCPLEWKYDAENQTRSQWHLSYENNFIVASKNAQLIKQWLDTMLQWIQLPYMQTQQQMRSVGMIEHKWTWDSTWHLESGRYLTAMDSLKYLLGKRQIHLQQQNQLQSSPKYKNSAHYYKLWSMPGQFLGQQKLRGETNYEQLDYRLSGYQKSYNTIYKYHFSLEYIESILGPISFQGKFFSRELAFMNKLINDFYSQNSHQFTIQKLHQLIHPQSLLAKALFNPDPNKTISLIKHYCTQAQMQRNFKGFSKIWTY